MFTGIIKEIGHVAKIEKKADGGQRITIISKKLKPKIGESIAVNGVCLTVIGRKGFGFSADVVLETLRLTNLGLLQEKSPVNLEPSLRLNDPLNGHFVTGHIDATGKVKNIPAARNAMTLAVTFPKKLSRFIAIKGSITINGVSLTVTHARLGECSAAIIPHTLATTNLRQLKKGDFVNIEVDILARYASGHNNLTIQ